MASNASKHEEQQTLCKLILIDAELWQRTRAGARSGRGFRYQDAVGALLAIDAWSGAQEWNSIVPEGVDDITLHGRHYEIRAQLKSRHDPQGKFSVQEAATHLAKMAQGLPVGWEGRIKLALVLERPVTGLSATGWRTTLTESGQSLGQLVPALEQAMNVAPAAVKIMLDRTYLVVEPEPLDRAVPKLEALSGLTPAAARLVLQQLRMAAGDAADQNFVASFERPASLGATDVQERIDAVSGIIDPSSYLALTAGLCEIANFGEAISPDDFYSGVNVMPGHVGAGLVFERPTYTTEILEALQSHRVALVAGQSGAGKSALAWLAAYHTRHAVRWYRVRKVSVDDVARLVQLARTLDATLARPVGFMVDDVGHDETAGWDSLVREMGALSGQLLLGSIREEDVFTLSTAIRSPTIRPALEEELAERIWKALSIAGTTPWQHWREPFELSKGLLLEYTHLLTEGRRLAETIQEQVRRRLAEKRDDELEILRPVAFAATHGAAINQSRLGCILGWEPQRFARALKRLLNEHAIHERNDGSLAGLHEIRSSYLDNALRETLCEPVETAMVVAVRALCTNDFAAYIVRTLRHWPGQHVTLIRALAQRVADDGASSLAPIMYGLGLASVDHVAERWLTICRSVGIDDRFAAFTLNLAMADVEFPGMSFFDAMKQAKAAFAKENDEDFRQQLAKQLTMDSSTVVFDMTTYHEFLATQLPLFGCVVDPESSLACFGNFRAPNDISELSLIPLLEAVRTASEVNPNIAQQLIVAAGGTQSLLARLYHETPWATLPALGETDGVTSISGDIRLISDIAQPDMHGDVVRFCELMSAAAPSAMLVVSNAIFPNGRPAGVGGISIATKRIPREQLPAPARVAWNRAQFRAVQRLVGTARDTDRTTTLALAIAELEKKLNEAADFYCRSEVPTAKWRLHEELRRYLTNCVPPPAIVESTQNAFDKGTYVANDKLYGFAEDLQNLIRELTDGGSLQPGLMAASTADLARAAETLSDPDTWRLTSQAPLDALSRMQVVLWDIRAVLGDAANDSARWRAVSLRFSRSSRKYPILSRAAKDARLRADEAVSARRKVLSAAFTTAGLEVQFFSKPNTVDRGFAWPDVNYAGLLVTDSVLTWLNSLERFQEIAISFAPDIRLSYAPLVSGRIPAMAVVLIQTLLPHLEFQGEWSSHLPFPFIEDTTQDHFTAAIGSLNTLSTIFAGRDRMLNEVENQFATTVFEKFKVHLNALIADLALTADESLAEAITFIERCFRRISAELGTPTEEETLAEEAIGWIDNKMTAFTTEVLHHRIMLTERALSKYQLGLA